MMLALRQRTAGIAQRARQSAANKTIVPPRRQPQQPKRSYASDHGHGHDHHGHGHGVTESPGKALYVALGGFGLYFAVYHLKDWVGEGTAFAKWIDSWRTDPATVLAQNTNMTNAFEQAASDRMLFHSSGEVRPTFELRTPELLNSGNPRNVPAGHSVNLDKVMEHYRQKHLAEEERKLKALEAERKLKAEQVKK